MRFVSILLSYMLLLFSISIKSMVNPYEKLSNNNSIPEETYQTFKQFTQLPFDVQKEILLYAASPKAHIDYGQEKDETVNYVDEISYVKACIKRLASYKSINKKINAWLQPKEIIDLVLGRNVKNDPAKQAILNDLFHEITTSTKKNSQFPDSLKKGLDRRRAVNIFFWSFQDCNLLNILLGSGYIKDIDAVLYNDSDSLKLLLDEGYSEDQAMMISNITPLKFAVLNKLPEVTQILINHGADLHQNLYLVSWKKPRTLIEYSKKHSPSSIQSILLKQTIIDINESSIIDRIPDKHAILLYNALDRREGICIKFISSSCIAGVIAGGTTFMSSIVLGADLSLVVSIVPITFLCSCLCVYCGEQACTPDNNKKMNSTFGDIL